MYCILYSYNKGKERNHYKENNKEKNLVLYCIYLKKAASKWTHVVQPMLFKGNCVFTGKVQVLDATKGLLLRL